MKGNLFLLLKHLLLFLKELEATLKATNLKRETSIHGTSIYGTAIYGTSIDEEPYMEQTYMEQSYMEQGHLMPKSVKKEYKNRSLPTSSSRCLLVSSNPSTSGCLVKSCLQRNLKGLIKLNLKGVIKLSLLAILPQFSY